MFPSQSNVLVFEDPLFFEQEKILEDLLADNAALEGDDLITSKGTKKRQRKNSSAGGITGKNDEGTNESKKIMHRDIERQRRQEMKGLYTSLRSLLPPEQIKGKRTSASDQMHEAVNHIKHMQKNIKELQIRRDKLKKLSNLSGANSFDSENGISNINHSLNCVTVSPCRDGLEFLISSPSQEGFPISKVLAELLGRGLNVVSCVSTREDKKTLHIIQIEVSDITSIDLSKLEDKLTNVVINQKENSPGTSSTEHDSVDMNNVSC